MKNKSQKLILTLLAVALAISLCAGVPLTASAEIGILDIGGDIYHNLETNQSGQGWTWTAATNTLALTSAYTGEHIIISYGLNATNTINLEYYGNIIINNSAGTAISCVGGDLNINGGGGKISIISSAGIGGVDSISALGSLTISSGHIDIQNNGGSGLYAQADLTINGGLVNIVAVGDLHGIHAINNVTISGNADVTINAYSGISTRNNFTIDGGMLNITSDAIGIMADNNVTISGGSGTITCSNTSVIGMKKIILGSNTTVKGWDGSGYTIPATSAIFDCSTFIPGWWGTDWYVFTDATNPAIALRNIQFSTSSLSADASLNLTTTSFDKNGGKDISVTLNRGRFTLLSIRNGDYTLIEGADYTVNGNTYTLKASYLSTLAVGNQTITFTMNSGEDPMLTIMVSTAVTPPAGSAAMSNFKKTRTYTPAMFSDVNENAWYGFYQQKAVANAYEYGLMQGNSTTIFNPAGNMTIAEAITVAARVHRIYSSGADDLVQSGSPWYKVYTDYAIDKEIITATDFSDYNRAATRAEMAYIFSGALPAAEFKEQNTVTTLPDVKNTTPYYNAIILLYKAGVVAGSDDKGTFNPGNNIIRAEAAAIISRVILPDARFSGKTFE